MTFRVAIIDINGLEIEEGETLKETSEKIINMKDSLKKEIEKYVKIIDVITPNDMMEKAVEIISMTPDMMGVTTTCYEDLNYIYQIVHVDSGAIMNDRPINSIASAIAYDKIRIYGKAVMLKSQMKENGQFGTANMTIDDIKMLLDVRTHHKGILVRSNGETEEREFIIDPVECCYDFTDEEKDNNTEKKLHADVSRLCGFQLITVHDKENAGSPNMLATSLSGSAVNSDAFMFIKNGDHDFLNLDKELFNDIKTIYEKGKLNDLRDVKCKYIISQYRKIKELQK